VEEPEALGFKTLEPVVKTVEPSYNLQFVKSVAEPPPPKLYSNGMEVNRISSPDADVSKI